MFDAFIQWLLDLFRGMGYPGIVVLMAVESSILPLPSELVMPPAGYLAAKGEMSFVVAGAPGAGGGAPSPPPAAPPAPRTNRSTPHHRPPTHPRFFFVKQKNQ